jgi:hypothetical protein
MDEAILQKTDRPAAGSWLVGVHFQPAVGWDFRRRRFHPATLSLIIAAMSAFMIRQPMTVMVKAYSDRRPKTDLPAARFWLLVYGSIAALALLGLIRDGFGYILYLAVPGVPVFAWHLWLVSQRAERKQAGVEVIATGVLSLAAPAAYWVGIREYDSFGWWLWALTWLQSAASIVYAYLRLSQRDWEQEQASAESRSEWLAGRESRAGVHILQSGADDSAWVVQHPAAFYFSSRFCCNGLKRCGASPIPPLDGNPPASAFAS